MLLYLYICFHSLVLNKIYSVGQLSDKSNDPIESIDLYEEEQILYAYVIHTLTFCMLVLIDQFTLLNKKLLYGVTCELPYIVVYHNLYNVLTFSSNIPVSYFKLSVSGMWLFTSSYITHILIKTCCSTTTTSSKAHVYTQYTALCMHFINFVSNACEVLSIHDKSSMSRTACNITMYALYATTLYYFFNYQTIYKYYIIYAWLIIGLNETLYIVDIISSNTYIMYTMLNDVCAKFLLFSLYMYKQVSFNSMANTMTLKDVHTMYEIQSMISVVNDGYARRSLQQDVSNILNNVDLRCMKYAIGDKVLPKSLTHEGMHKLIKDKGIALSNIVIMFSDVVNYSKIAKSESDTHVLNTLRNLYAAYDAELKRFPLLQKVENIGDCYLVSSCFINNDSDDENTYDSCHQMFNYSKALIKIANSHGIDTRVGLHLGDVRLGIIGDDVPRFGIVGHNVNLASRLESTCEVNCIQVSEAFYLHYSAVRLAKREVDLKNIGRHIAYIYDPKKSLSFSSNSSVESESELYCVTKSNEKKGPMIAI